MKSCYDNRLLTSEKDCTQPRGHPKLKVVNADILPVSERIKTFPATRYYGSKKRHLSWIHKHISGEDFNSVLDGFGGTGSVSLLFKAMGKEVTYHDAFLFNKYVATAVLSNRLCVEQHHFEKFVCDVKPRKGLIYRNFRSIYYTDAENCWLDGFMMKLLRSNFSKQELSLYMYTLYQACLQKRPFNLFHRANLYLRLNKRVKRSFGNLVTWERTFPELMSQAYEDVSKAIWNSRSKIKILPASNITKIKPDYDLVYIDPPYIACNESLNRDDYWKRYHFLEGLANYQSWESSIEQDSKLKCMPQPEKFLQWSRKKTFKEKLYSLIKRHRKSVVALSYVSNAYPNKKDITGFFESVFKDVSVHSKNHRYALSKTTKREMLFIGRP